MSPSGRIYPQALQRAAPAERHLCRQAQVSKKRGGAIYQKQKTELCGRVIGGEDYAERKRQPAVFAAPNCRVGAADGQLNKKIVKEGHKKLYSVVPRKRMARSRKSYGSSDRMCSGLHRCPHRTRPATCFDSSLCLGAMPRPRN